MIRLKQNGWIGIDIGTSTVKLAQLTRSKKKLCLNGYAIIARRETWPAGDLSNHDPISSADEICAAVSLRPGFRGNRAAAVLPMALCNTHSLDQPVGQHPEEARFVRAAIEMATQRSAENLQFDAWNAESEKGQLPKKSNALTLASTWSDQIVDDITELGWCCQTVDGLPLALARAVSLTEGYDPNVPLAVLDLGHTKATLCIVLEGRPVYVRSLKNCGMHLLLDKLRENLNITHQEAQFLLQESSLGESQDSSQTPAEELIEEIIAEPISQLVAEYQRTVSHLQSQRRSILPRDLTLFGGGATINGLAERLSQKLATSVQVWQFPNIHPDLAKLPSLPSCLFGPAIALSALAWEKS